MVIIVCVVVAVGIVILGIVVCQIGLIVIQMIVSAIWVFDLLRANNIS